MFAPEPYRATDPRALVRQYPFALLVTQTAAGAFATQTPVLFETDADGEQRLVGHLAGRNGHAAALETGQDTLLVFQGPHAYVSAEWYRDLREVPTWNYVTAQVRGRLEVLDEPADKLAVVARTAAVMEQGAARPWTVADTPDGMLDKFLSMIRAFRIDVTSFEGATKLNQRHDEADRLRVIRALLLKGDPGSIEIARLMAAL